MTNQFLRRPWWQQVIIMVAASFVIVELAGLIGTKVMGPAIGWGEGTPGAPFQLAVDTFDSRFDRWDSGYYLQIAQNGYRPAGVERAFFPLYPLFVRLVSNVSHLSLLWSGLVVSIVCFVGAGLFLYRWVLIDYPDEIARWAVLWVCCIPMAFFFIAIYSEALFLLLSIASVYFARRGRFVASGVAIALAGATRPSALLLAIPYLLEFWQQKNFSRLQFLRMGVGAVIAPLGAAAYALFLMIIGGNTNFLGIYLANQSAEWKRYLTWPWITLYDGLRSALVGAGIKTDWFSRAEVWHDLIYALGGMAGAIWSLFHLRLSAAFYLLISMGFFYISHGPYGYAFWSIPRYAASLFPFYLVLALLTSKLPKYGRWFVVLVSIGFLGVLSAWFATGRWVA